MTEAYARWLKCHFQFRKKGSLHRTEEPCDYKVRVFLIIRSRECMATLVLISLESKFQTWTLKYTVHH